MQNDYDEDRRTRTSTRIDVDLVILDFDGTIADTRQDMVDAVNLSLADLELPAREPDTVAGFIGRGVDKLLRQSLPADKPELLGEALKRFGYHYDQIYNKTTTLYSGVLQGLTNLAARDILLAVASNKPSRYLNLLLDEFNLRQLFSWVFGGDKMKEKKPHPWCIHEILAQSRCSASRTLMVGDMIYDMETGTAAGILNCGVTYGYGSEAELRRAGARFFVSSFDDLVYLVV